MRALTRWRLGRNRRLVIAVICVPMPPCFLALPLRQMMLPFIGRFPVSSQIRAIIILSLDQGAEKLAIQPVVASTNSKSPLVDRRQSVRGDFAQEIPCRPTNFPARVPKQ